MTRKIEKHCQENYEKVLKEYNDIKKNLHHESNFLKLIIKQLEKNKNDKKN